MDEMDAMDTMDAGLSAAAPGAALRRQALGAALPIRGLANG